MKRAALMSVLCSFLAIISLSSAQAVWVPDGVAMAPAREPDPSTPYIVSDGFGGAIIAWSDQRSGGNYPYDIYAQRVDASGAVQWTVDGIAICTAADNQQSIQIVSDGSGGAIITWQDYRSGGNRYDIYAQRVDASGAVRWTADGVGICTAVCDDPMYVPHITADGSGGAIITWVDNRGGSYYDIYAQRVSASGAVQWTADGVAICTATNHQRFAQIVSDGSGGAIITWEDRRGGSYSDIYTQRVDASGAVQWTVDGVAVCTAANHQYYPEIASDGSGGAIITWADFRGGSYQDIYAQRVDASGAVQWTADGVAICAAADNQQSARIVSDDSGGAIIAWEDRRGGSNSDIYTQRVDASGAIQWTADGVAVCTAVHHQYYPEIASDGSGGAIITWEDRRDGSYYDIYAQRVDASGVVQWTVDGVAICEATYTEYYPMIAPDGSGGAIITWLDDRGVYYVSIYTQRVDASGAAQWIVDGVAVCKAANHQHRPDITTDGSGGAIIAWEDYRLGSYSDIYAQRVDAGGAVRWTADGFAICTAANQQSYPAIVSDGSGGAIITWEDSRGGSYSDIYVQRVDASGDVQWAADGVAICTAANHQQYPEIASDGSGGSIITWRDYRGGSYYDIYAQRVDASGAVKWTVDGVAVCTAANHQYNPEIASDGSGGAIITWADRRGGSYQDIYAQRVDASGAVQWTADGVAICAAANQQQYVQIVSDGSGGAIITWEDRRDVSYQDIYAQLVSASGAVQWTAHGVAICTAAYNQHAARIVSDGSRGAIVTWQDYRSGSTNEIYAQRVDSEGNVYITGVDAASAYRLAQNYPNPFNPSTLITFEMKARGFVSLKVYNVAGQLVRTLVNGARDAGSHSVSWDGKNDRGVGVASGIYFCRIDTKGYSQTSTMVLLR